MPRLIRNVLAGIKQSRKPGVTPATVADSSWVGRVLGGRYRVAAELGSGGMGLVYRARDQRLGSEVVVKAPRRSLLEDPDFAARFGREVQSLVRLHHPHVVKALDVGEEDGLPFVVLDFLRGGSLRDRQPRDAAGNALPMAPSDLASWLPDVAAALDFVHAQGYVHRDVKPDNVLFDEHGNAYLSDLGIAKALAAEEKKAQHTALTGAGVVLGTPQYMAPELVSGQSYDGRADQYALAVMVYELLAGRPPFDAPTGPAVMALHLARTPPPLRRVAPSVSEALSAAVERALAKDPRKRFPTCAAFARAVLSAADTAPAPAPRPAAPRAAAPAAETILTRFCPQCGTASRVRASALGKRLRCRTCGARFRLDAGQPAGMPETVRAGQTEASPRLPAPDAGPVPRRRRLLPCCLLVLLLLSAGAVAWSLLGAGIASHSAEWREQITVRIVNWSGEGR